jgi:L-histidine N-alpha-methyltransferase
VCISGYTRTLGYGKRKMKSSKIDIKNHLHSSFHHEIRKDILKGLTSQKKSIPSKYFYDERGSRLFEEICCLPEYYPTRTEMIIIRRFAPEIMNSLPEGDIVELGSGANWKIRAFLNAVECSKLSYLRYVQVDVSEAAIIESSKELLELYPELETLGIVADFTKDIDAIRRDRPTLILFLGSTIGNFSRELQRQFLKAVADSMKREDRFLLGMDMMKSRDVLEAAYNDSQGITAEFNMNILRVLNRELNADFNMEHFDHLAFFNEEKKQVEMHLLANRGVSVKIQELGVQVELEKGETIHTEVCRKFSRTSAEQMAGLSGLVITRWFSDPREWFALVEMRRED